MEQKRAVLFDLDGTLLPMDNEYFIQVYFKLLCKKMAAYGYDPDRLVQTVWRGTKAMMKNVAKSFINGDIEIIEYPSKYCFAVKFTSKTGVPYNLEDIKSMISEEYNTTM